MKYTNRELKIISSNEPLNISDEEFLLLLNKATLLKDVAVSGFLMDMYEEIFFRTEDEEYLKCHSDPADNENLCLFPILLNTSRNTEKRIKNMITYLTGKLEVNNYYITLLHQMVPYKRVYNYITDEYYKDYLPIPLWEEYFLQVPQFKKFIMLRSIKNLDDLIYRTTEYFERYIKKKKIKNFFNHNVV